MNNNGRPGSDRPDRPARSDPHDGYDGYYDRHGNEISLRNGRISGDFDLPTLLKGVRDAVIIGGLVLTWIAPALHPVQSALTEEKIEAATYSGMSRALTEHDVVVEPPVKAAPMKGTGSGRVKPKPVPTAKPADGHSGKLHDGEMITTRETPAMIFSSMRPPDLPDATRRP